mmetsp:Transcript_38/g.112  ORF Transcript_38/g.112 Transcript_38/m.112 type:complete len:86 (-) Transcript_38:1413-1670(-)
MYIQLQHRIGDTGLWGAIPQLTPRYKRPSLEHNAVKITMRRERLIVKSLRPPRIADVELRIYPETKVTTTSDRQRIMTAQLEEGI